MEHMDCEMFMAIKLRTFKNTFCVWVLSVSSGTRGPERQIRATSSFSCEGWRTWQKKRWHAVNIKCKGSNDIRKGVQAVNAQQKDYFWGKE